MQIIRDVATLRSAVFALRQGGRTVAMVPTMGALHAGHMALVDAARGVADHVVASIFVNPKQFGANEDLDTYPRREEADARMLADHGVAILWAPTVEEMYPVGFSTNISVTGISDELCGAVRPGHFDGVATVVCKLLNQVGPDIALFGEKDYQQLAVIRRMVADLNLPVDIRGVPTQRATDGLALSSRNAYLSETERAAAIALPQALLRVAAQIRAGGDIALILDQAKADLISRGFGTVDYFEFCDPDTLEPIRNYDGKGRLLAAARMGKTRLIDNIDVNTVA